MKRMLLMTAVLMMVSTMARSDNWFAGGLNSSKLEQIHKAYLKGNYKNMLDQIKVALMDPATNSLDKINMINLVEEAYQQRQGRLPAVWHLPAGIDDLKVDVVRRAHRGRTTFSLEVKGEMETPELVEQLRVTKFPDQIIADREADVGAWEEDIWRGTPEFAIESERRADPIAAGLYLLHIRLANGAVFDAWFVLTEDSNPSTSPMVFRPQDGESLPLSNLDVNFRDYRSPQYREFEYRAMSIYLTELFPESDEHEYRWGFYTKSPSLEKVTLGMANRLGPAVDINPGIYWMSLKYIEARRFGDLRIRRISTVSRQFKIRAGSAEKNRTEK